MKLFITFLTLTIIPISDELACIRSKQPNITLDSELPTKTLLQQLRSYLTKEFIHYDLCRVRLYITSNSPYMIITFTDVLKDSDVSNEELRVETNLEYIKNQESLIVRTLEYACSEADQCEKEFIFQQIVWFTNALLDHLHSILEPLVVAPNFKPGECFIEKNVTRKCSLKTCVSKRSTEDSEYQRTCEQREPFPDNSLQIRIKIFARTQKIEQTIVFRCQYHLCNNDTNLRQIDKISLADISLLQSEFVFKPKTTITTSLTTPQTTSIEQSTTITTTVSEQFSTIINSTELQMIDVESTSSDFITIITSTNTATNNMQINAIMTFLFLSSFYLTCQK